MGERGSSAASCSVPLMVTDMERRKPAASKSELILGCPGGVARSDRSWGEFFFFFHNSVKHRIIAGSECFCCFKKPPKIQTSTFTNHNDILVIF